MVASWLFATTFVTSNVRDKYNQIRVMRLKSKLQTLGLVGRGSVTQLGCIAKDLPDKRKG